MRRTAIRGADRAFELREQTMNLCVTCNEAQPRTSLSNGSTTVVAVITAMTFAASGAAPTALYHQYQDSFGLAPFAVTVVFAAYVLSLLAALLTAGSLSDFIGRRPAILAALALNIVFMAMFMTAGSQAALIAARALQGFATGLATASIGAAILDNDRDRGPILNSITAFCGMTAGTLGGAILVTYAPDPRQLVYVVLLALSAVEAFILWFMPETAELRAGAIAW
jgi:MFS family permease